MLKKSIVAMLLAATLAGGAQAQLKYVEGADYTTLTAPVTEAKAGQVINFFWYGCGHCYAM